MKRSIRAVTTGNRHGAELQHSVVESADVKFETRSLPNLLVATLATLPSMSLIPSAPLKLARCPHSLAPTLVTLPSMSLIPSAPLQAGHTANIFQE